MNKWTLSALSLAAAFSIQAADTFPGWGGKDAAAFQKAAASSTGLNTKANNLVMYRFLNEKVKTFDGLCKIVDEVCDELYEKPVQNAERKLTIKKMFAFCRGQFVAEAIAFAEKNPSWYDVYLGNINKADNTKRYNFLLTAYKRYFYNFQPDMHLKTLNNLAAWGKAGKVASLKGDLAKLKAHYDRISSKDKAKWSAVLQKYDEIMKTL